MDAGCSVRWGGVELGTITFLHGSDSDIAPTSFRLFVRSQLRTVTKLL